MKNRGKKELLLGSISIIAFLVWTALIQIVDVQPIGQNGTDIGFSSFNSWFHKWTGVHMGLYILTDWLSIIPLFVCMLFGVMGLVQFMKRRSLWKVDYDIIFLGIYYVVVIFSYLIFERIPINYRPILIEGVMEVSYPSSTTLLVLSVMPTLSFQINQRVKNENMKKMIGILTNMFSMFMVIGRLVSGVHWFTDIVGSVMLSFGFFSIYKAVILLYHKEKRSLSYTCNGTK